MNPVLQFILGLLIIGSGVALIRYRRRATRFFAEMNRSEWARRVRSVGRLRQSVRSTVAVGCTAILIGCLWAVSALLPSRMR